MKEKKFLVTGGAGFIGSHLVDALLDTGHRVTVLDDLSVGNMLNLEPASRHPGFKFVQGSILDEALVDALMTDVDGVYHLAAVVGVKYVVEDPLHGMQVNLRGTEILLEAAFRHKCKILIASSSETYGKSTRVPFGEEDNSILGPTSVPRWSYAVSKLLDEHLAFAYYRQKALPTVAVRYFNAYGPRLDPRGYGSVVAKFLTQALKGEPLTVYGDGEQTRSFTFVKDIVQGTIAAMETPQGEGLAFNIGNAREFTVNELAHHIQILTASDAEVTYIPYQHAYGIDFEDTQRRLPDVSRATSILGFRASVSLEQGLRETILWFKE